MTRPLVIVSSRTGNTRILAHAVCDALEGAELCDASNLPADLSPYNPVVLAFWCDKGRAPEEMARAALRLSGKRIGCLATVGGDPTSERGRAWMKRTSESLVGCGGGNTLETTFACRGRVDPKVFEAALGMMGPEAAERHKAARAEGDRHPDRLDVLHAVEAFTKVFGG